MSIDYNIQRAKSEQCRKNDGKPTMVQDLEDISKDQSTTTAYICKKHTNTQPATHKYVICSTFGQERNLDGHL